MSDKELLELTAKAAGLVVVDRTRPPISLYIQSDGCHGGVLWNPLADDGDALRVASKLFLWEAVMLAHRLVSSDLDIYAATRRAIVHAAAEIGRTMP